MKVFICIFSLLLGGSSVLAQFSDIDQVVIGNLGAEIGNGNYLITQSVGDLVGTEVGSSNQGISLVQGFPQCFVDKSCDPNSIDPSLSSPLVSIFPNPTTNILTLEGERRFLHRFELYLANGQLMKSDRLETSELDLSDLRAGLYFLRIYDRQKKLSFSGSILKQ